MQVVVHMSNFVWTDKLRGPASSINAYKQTRDSVLVRNKMIPDRYVKLSRFLGVMGFSLDLSTLQSRIVLQKRVYFAEALGTNLGYHFGWYVFGPYSTDLTRDAYGLQGLESHLRESNDAMPETQKLKGFLGKVGTLQPERTEGYWLELLSSLHFLAVQASPPVRGKEQCIVKIELMKPGRFSREDVESAWKLLVAYNLVAS